MAFSYHTEQWLPYSAEEIFGFLANPQNLPSLMPAWQKARVENSSIVPPPRRPGDSAPPNPAAGIGTRLTFSFRPFRFSPVRVQWEAEVTEFSWNTQFCDRQVRGPFAYWHHCHRVRAVIREEVAVAVLTDHVEYALPMGALGTLAHRLFLRRRIDQAFAYRYSQLASILGARQTGNSSVATRLDRSA
ncbi:MAG TPA: SRPBCC family protein [Acidobacteriaceae bacterium]